MDAQERIWEMSVPEPNSGCWLWLGGTYGSGYGAEGRDGAHRVSYRAFKGAIPDGMLVRHSCDVTCCVNPDHLSIGTNQDNTDDKVRRGRAAGQPKGERHWKAALTPEQVIAIRADTRRQATIAASYGVRQQAISKIKRGENWQHVGKG